MGTLMVTARINVVDKFKKPIECRTLIDTCSNANFITETLARRLGFKGQECAIPIGVVDGLSTISKSMITTTIQSRTSGYSRATTFLIVPIISNQVPQGPIQRDMIKIAKNLKLADPNFHQVAPVEMLLGTGIALSILSVGQIDLSPEGGPELFMQKTKLGWVIGGSAPTSQPSRLRSCHFTSELQSDLTKFWELEACPTTIHNSESECERHFLKHVQRLADGRYSVALPFNEKKQKLGESLYMARKRFKALERKFIGNPEFYKKYHTVLNEYIESGHMAPINQAETSDHGFYLSHHAVLKPGSLTTAVRVVFDGSVKSSTGVSLNDTLLVGPTIQPELFALLLRFRKYPIAITADIQKMYLQFLVRPEDRKYQRILWYNSNGDEQTYELNRVTFGLASVPYLAIRCLHQLAQDEEHSYPKAAEILQNELYVDDLLTGANTVEDVIVIRNQLTNLLETGDLKIRQWASNDPQALKGLPTESINQHLLLKDSSTIKTLGIKWDSGNDTIIYNVNRSTVSDRITKRTIMSEIVRIFDPLGLLAPIPSPQK